MNAYKTKQKLNSICKEELTNQKENDALENPIFSENSPPDSIKINIKTSLQAFQNAFMTNSFSEMSRILDEITRFISTFQLDENSFEYFINSNIINQIFHLFTNSPSSNIYQLTLWLISNIFEMSFKYQRIIIIKAFESLNLFNYILTKFNPNYLNFLNGDTKMKMTIDLNNEELIGLLPYYLHILSYYYYLFDNNYRNIILNLIIIPNLDIFYDDFDNIQLIIEASYLINRSTFFQLNEEYNNYIKWIITSTIQNWDNLDNQSQSYLLNAILNLSSSKKNLENLFFYQFASYLDKCNDKIIGTIFNKINDEIMKTALLIQIKLLENNPELVKINYEKLIKIGTSNFPQSKLAAFALFRCALNLKKKDSPFNDNIFFQSFINIFQNGSFDVKSEFIRIIEVWLLNSSQKIILERAPAILPEITPILLEVSLTDQLNYLILEELKIFFENAQKNTIAFRKLKEVFAQADGINILETIMQDIETPEENSQLAQSIYSLFLN